MISSFALLIGRMILWCMPAAIGLTALESIGQTLTAGYLPLSFSDYFLQFSNSSLLLFGWLCLFSAVLSFIFVWLGGIRPGIVRLFLFLFFFLFTYLIIVLDILFTYTDQYALHWHTIMRYFGVFSFLVAGAASLILGKISRNRQWSVPPRLFFAFTLFLFLLSLCFQAKPVFFDTRDNTLFWGGALLVILTSAVGLTLFAKSTRRLNLLLFLLLVLIHGSAGCIRFQKASTPLPDPAAGRQIAATVPSKQILLITVDTLRQDALGLYGNLRAKTPHLDTLGKDSLVFTRAYSPAPWTYPAVASFLTGVSPRVHGMTNGKTSLPPAIPTLAESMQQAGYRSCAIGTNAFLLPRSGLDRGFDEYFWFPAQVVEMPAFTTGLSHNLLLLGGRKRANAAVLTDHAIDWLQQHRNEPFFLWVHYFDPHVPYEPPENFLPEDPELRKAGSSFSDVRAARAGSIARTAREREWIRALYQGDVSYTDEQIGRLLGALKLLKLYDDALIFLTADHGEEFWEHGHFEHGHNLYNPLVQVPLLLKQPKSIKTGIVEVPVTTLGIMPTLMESCGQAVPSYLAPNTFPVSLHNEQPGESAPPVFIGTNIFYDPLESVVFRNKKYIRSLTSSAEELFDLSIDPAEKHSIATDVPELVAEAQALLKKAEEEDAALRQHFGIGDESDYSINLEDVRSLEALGYL